MFTFEKTLKRNDSISPIKKAHSDGELKCENGKQHLLIDLV